MITVSKMINVSSNLNTLRKFVALEFRRYKLKFEASRVWKSQTSPSGCSNGLVQEVCNSGLRKGAQSTTMILSCSETRFQKDDSHLCRSWLFLRGRLNPTAISNIPLSPHATLFPSTKHRWGGWDRETKENVCALVHLHPPALHYIPSLGKYL